MQWVTVIIISLLLFTLTSFVHTNSICCMFAAIRSYGFPGQFVVISKETDSLEEAKKVNTVSTQELLKQGWHIKFGASMDSPISQSAAFNGIVNMVVSFIISMIGVVLVHSRYKKKGMKKVFYWLPRIVSIVFIVFISLFALDVVGQPNWPVAVFMHLIPSYILIALTIIAWKNELLGGFLFLAAGLAFLIFTHFQALIISIPAFSIGLLFLLRKYLFKV
jgi:hypothetical protein